MILLARNQKEEAGLEQSPLILSLKDGSRLLHGQVSFLMRSAGISTSRFALYVSWAVQTALSIANICVRSWMAPIRSKNKLMSNNMRRCIPTRFLQSQRTFQAKVFGIHGYPPVLVSCGILWRRTKSQKKEIQENRVRIPEKTNTKRRSRNNGSPFC